VAGHRERLAIAVCLRDLRHSLDVHFGERTLHGPAVQFQDVSRERQCELARRRRPVNRRAGVAAEQRRDRAHVVEMAVAHHDCFGIGVARELRRSPRFHPVVEQEAIVYQNRAPADFSRTAQKPNIH